jgi:hypothetical protein
VADEHRYLTKVWQECNWLQALEGGIDSVHSTFLHFGRPPGLKYEGAGARMRALNVGTSAHLEIVPTDYGYSYASMRDMGEEGTNYVRGYHWVMPWNQIRASGEEISGHMWVPMDDENTMVYNWDYNFKEPLRRNRPQEAAAAAGSGGRAGGNWIGNASMSGGGGNEPGIDVDTENNFRSVRNRDNNYMIDRHLQKTQTFTGVTGINTQDRQIAESMGAIADRTLERLGTTDRAIINARRALLAEVKTVEDGGDPPGVAPTYYQLRAIEKVLPKDTHWWEALKPDLYGAPAPVIR